MPDPLVRYAGDLAESLLGSLPDVHAQAQRSAEQAEQAASRLRRPRIEILTAAALLHGIGHASALHSTGFAPVDGAAELRAQGWPDPVVSLVAHQMQARLVAPYVGVATDLAGIPRIQGWPADILDFAILTSTAQGTARSVDDGLADVRRQQESEARLPGRVARERLTRLARAGYRVRDALVHR